jgi:hypothetical protein
MNNSEERNDATLNDERHLETVTGGVAQQGGEVSPATAPQNPISTGQTPVGSTQSMCW